MSGLFSALNTSAGALDAFQRVLDTIQSNVANASTPGYARQSMPLEALSFDSSGNLPGGVTTGEMQSARDQFAEQNVRQQVSTLGTLEQSSQSLSNLELNFNVSSDSGIPGALNQLFQNFSSWSVTPGDGAARQSVIDAAQQVAQSFQQAGANLAKASSDTGQQIQQTVAQINSLASQLQADNQAIIQGHRGDAGLDAQIHATLEQLSEFADITATAQPDGTVTVLLGGQTPLVIGQNQYNVSVSFTTPASAPPTVAGGAAPARLIDAQGNDITANISQGQLAGQLNIYNKVLPSLGGNAYQQGSLNLMAQSVADRINQILTSGNISDGPPPVPGVPLFTYTAGSPTSVARTLAVSSTITPAQLAAIAPGPPYVSNGTALQLAGLASPQNPADEISGFSYAQFYGNLAAGIGRQSQAAQNQLSVQQQTVAQARNLRSQSSGVSLNDEAALLVQFQSAYDANSKMVTVLDHLTQATINMIQ
jgi:flagellar hook-associated protein 1 FlgK